MSKFSSNSRLSDLIHANIGLLPVITRFNIELGFGDITVQEICEINQINTDFFLEIVNAFHNEHYFPKQSLLQFSSLLVVNYLSKTHQYYTEVLLPELDDLLEKMLKHIKGNNKTYLDLIKKFYSDYKNEFLAHIDDEEKNVFPYIREIQSVYDKGKTYNNLSEKAQSFSIRTFEKEHGSIDEKLLDLKNIILKYLPPNYNSEFCHAFLIKLFFLEKDLIDHARIEDKILIPKVIELESELKRKNK
jgi:regulator of cell morphogenesis and NO signaling